MPLRIRDAETGWPVSLDVSNDGQLVTIDVGHESLHDGETFMGICLINTIASGAYMNMGIEVGAVTTGVPVYFRATAGGDARLWLLESPTYSGGAAVTMINKNRTSVNTLANVAVLCNPSLTTSGVILAQHLLVGGGAFNLGGAPAEERGWILNTNTNYILRVINDAAGVEPIEIGIVALTGG